MSQKTVEDVIGEGTAIAHYRVLGPLGAGGMGAVYKAHDEKLNRIVAVKILSAGAVAHEDRRRRFLQEARAASALNHPHILTVYEIGDTGGRPFIVMEYVEGETLRQKIAARSLAVRDALEIAIQIAQGLTKAHEHGIVHRDLKPENLMINRDGYAKILDFGLAKLIERKRAAAAGASAEQTIIQVNTHSGTIMGTVKYMSPEQVLGRRIDLRSDIFSFAVVLYEMLTGVPPFVRDNDIDTMHSILHDEPRPPHAVRPELPRVLHTVLARALSKEPRQRYQTISEFAAAIQSLKRDIEAGKTSAPVKTRLVLKPVTTARARAPKIDYERELNEAQYEAVMTADGPLLIIAGAGTGKTRTLVYRVARLIEMAAKPESILLLTFTRRAAQSMLGKAAALADERCQRVAGGTFHSMAHATLRRHPELAGVHRMFTVFDQSDTEDLIDLVRRQTGLTKDRHFPRKRTIAGVFSMAANKLLSVEEVVKQYYPQFVAATGDLVKLYAAFDSYKRERHLLTYDDLLTRLAEALEASEELRLKLSNQYRYIMVDEYQDTNQRQAQIVRLLAAAHDNVAVVGDECQSIYAFRGANFRNMLEFPDLFPGARVIKLEENFRSTQPILDLANTLIGEASEGYSKQLFSRLSDGPAPVLVNASDENEQSRFVVQRIEELREEGVPYQEMAVLFRAGAHSFDLEIELGRHGVPFRKFGGIKFVESAHIKDLLAFLRAVVNPSDVISWCRMLKLVDHVGDATVQQILDFLGVEKKEFRTPRARAALFQKLSQFPARASYADQLQKLARLLQRVFEEKSVGAQLTALERFYRPIMQSAYDDHPRRQREIEHLKSIGKRYKSAEELLADVALDPVEMALAESQARGQGFVTLSTVHSAKGLEWKALFLIWMVDGWFPSLRSYDAFEDLEEERRLLYVAATRAKEHLYFISPSTYDAGGTSAYGGVSRFLEPVPETLLPRAELQ